MERFAHCGEGHDISLSNIEAVILKHPSVQECAVAAMPNPIDDTIKIPTAFIVLKKSEKRTMEIIYNINWFCKKLMNEKDIVQAYHICDKLPRDEKGEIIYSLLGKIL